MLKKQFPILKEGFKAGIPIGLGYFAVSFSLGIVAANAGLSAIQGFVTSLLCNASAGEYAGFVVIASNAGYLQMVLMSLVANIRYLLMSTALSQRCDEKMSLIHRLILSFYITDELFGITIARNGKVNPYYTYGAIIPATLLWASGTALGIIAGNVLSPRIVSALSVALYGMFIAIIIPPAKKNKVILFTIIVCFISSYLSSYYIPYLKDVTSGTRTVILTVIICSIVAYFFPHKENESNE